jgi:hypothetical protein
MATMASQTGKVVLVRKVCDDSLLHGSEMIQSMAFHNIADHSTVKRLDEVIRVYKF